MAKVGGKLVKLTLTKLVDLVKEKAANQNQNINKEPVSDAVKQLEAAKPTGANDNKPVTPLTDDHGKAQQLAEQLAELGELAAKEIIKTAVDKLVDKLTKDASDQVKPQPPTRAELDSRYLDTAQGKVYNFPATELARYGELAHQLAQDKTVQLMAGEWGIGRHNTNQLFEHTLAKITDPNRLPGLEKKAGLEAGSLTKIFSTDPQEVIEGLINFHQLGQQIIANPTASAVLQDGRKEIFWLQSVVKPSDGIAVMKYNGKINTIMNMKNAKYKQELIKNE